MKNYNEALEKAKQLLRTSAAYDRFTIEAIFPELKESNDDRVKKSIYNYINATLDDNESAEKEKWLAWIEKQGTPAKLSEEEQNSFAKSVRTNCAMSFIDYLDAHRYEGKMCVSNDECEDIENAFHNAMWDRLHRYYCKYIEKPCEKKPTNTSEPKFKFENGEWYVCTQTFVLRGENVVIKGHAYKSNQNGAVEGENKHLFIDAHDGKASDYFRPWTIQDAKDGDVLVNWNSTIYLFKEIEEDVVKFYCYYNIYCEEFKLPFNNNSHLGLTEPQFEHYPATKEQRDLLFQKMKEAGYEWDSEHKQLKMVDEEEYNEEDYGSDGLYHALDILERTLGKVTGYQSDDGIIDHKRAISTVRKLYKQKHAKWSEDDMSKVQRIRKCLNEAKKYYAGVTEVRECMEWLDTLKDRLRLKRQLKGE